MTMTVSAGSYLGTAAPFLDFSATIRRVQSAFAGTANFTNVDEEESPMTNQVLTPSVSIEIERAIKTLISHSIVIPRIDEVSDILAQHIGLSDTVVCAARQAHSAFSSSVQLSLEVDHDPEMFDSQLTLYVRQENYSPDIMDRIENFRERLYNEDRDCFDNMFVTTDFQLPR